MGSINRKEGTMFLNPDQLIQAVRLTPLVSIDLIVRDPSGAVLAGLRANRPAQNCWFVPGGRICKDERLVDAFARISRNELGAAFDIRQARLRGIYEHLYEDNFAGEPGVSTHYVVLAFELHLSQPLPALPEEQHQEFRWFAVDELLQGEDVHPNTKAYFQGDEAHGYH
jgi:colanic acid biosynthesis protein WcaH